MSAMKTDGTHVCQLHHDEDELAQDVVQYVKEGLVLGSAVVVVAGDKRRRNLEQFLAANASGERVRRLLTVIDSGILLAKFMRGDTPDRGRFRDAICPILEKALASGNGSLRAYGEMVNDLWHDGNPAAAITLERYWNELLQEYEFSLFCGYVLDAFDPDSYGPCLEEVCVTHTHVASTTDEDNVRKAIDDACQNVLGIHLSSLLRHSQPAGGKWHVRLPLSRRVVLWLKSNTASRLTHVLGIARNSYTKRTDCVVVR